MSPPCRVVLWGGPAQRGGCRRETGPAQNGCLGTSDSYDAAAIDQPGVEAPTMSPDPFQGEPKERITLRRLGLHHSVASREGLVTGRLVWG